PARTAGSLARRTAAGPANALRHGDRCPADRSAPTAPVPHSAAPPRSSPVGPPRVEERRLPPPGTGGGRGRGGGARGAAALSPGDITAHQRGSCTAASRLLPGPPGPAALSRSLFRGVPTCREPGRGGVPGAAQEAAARASGEAPADRSRGRAGAGLANLASGAGGGAARWTSGRRGHGRERGRARDGAARGAD